MTWLDGLVFAVTHDKMTTRTTRRLKCCQRGVNGFFLVHSVPVAESYSLILLFTVQRDVTANIES